MITSYSAAAEKVYVVERERGQLGVVANGSLKTEIKNLGQLHHATLKFHQGFGYIISRDGYLSKIDPQTDMLVKKVKVGESSIGLTPIQNWIAVANYEPGTVVILDSDLNTIKTIVTGSRNVGIKATKDYLVFALMDKDEIWVLDANRSFKYHRVFTQVGGMPFDALISDSIYMVGFYKEQAVGLLNLETMKFIKSPLQIGKNEPLMKIPHFGLWGVAGKNAFVPSVGERQLHIFDLQTLEYEQSIALKGLPVFISLAPNGLKMAVNYSGDQEDFLSLLSTKPAKVLKNLKIGKRIMHMKYSPDGQRIYLSSYYENVLKEIDSQTGQILSTISVPSPSGIFILPGSEGKP